MDRQVMEAKAYNNPIVNNSKSSKQTKDKIYVRTISYSNVCRFRSSLTDDVFARSNIQLIDVLVRDVRSEKRCFLLMYAD
jgi:hypothetical protein